MIRKIVLCIILIVIVAGSAGVAFSEMSQSEWAKMPLSARYPGPWKDQIYDFLNLLLVRAMVKKDIRGCGEMYFRQSLIDPHEYLIKCSDGVSSSLFIVVFEGGNALVSDRLMGYKIPK